MAISQKTDTINWSPCYSLQWEDFEGVPDTTKKSFDAVSNPVVKYFLSSTEDTFNIKVICFFVKSKSWARFKNNDYLLLHERGHFNIAELFARKLRKAFNEYKFNYQTIRTDIQKIFINNTKERAIMDSIYDKETNYSKDNKKQEEWSSKIEKELNKLKEFKN